MNRRALLVWLIVLVLALYGCAPRALAVEQASAQVVNLLPLEGAGQFERIEGPRPLTFPVDHGPHPEYQTEWWYYTGNLAGLDGQRFGYQLTFFRRALLPEDQRIERSSAWALEQVYMAHFTVTAAQPPAGVPAFRSFERFERGAAGLAGATGQPAYSVWLRDWQVQQTAPDTYLLQAAAGDARLALTLVDRKGIILQGDQGYSQKGPEAGNASLYYSQTRLESSGELTLGGTTYPVQGFSWLDREISTSALSAGQVGWDWFALQLDDGSELMAYVLRRADGSIDRFSSGNWIAPDGSTTPLTRDDFQIEALDSWVSPHSGGTYPAQWQIDVPGQDLSVTVTPLVADQELDVSFVYWEGAVRVEGTRAGQPVSGYGYVELTGYADSLEGEV